MHICVYTKYILYIYIGYTICTCHKFIFIFTSRNGSRVQV